MFSLLNSQVSTSSAQALPVEESPQWQIIFNQLFECNVSCFHLRNDNDIQSYYELNIMLKLMIWIRVMLHYGQIKWLNCMLTGDGAFVLIN